MLKLLSSRGFLLLIIVISIGTAAIGQTTTFTYQGKITYSNVPQPTNGNYDMQFRLWDNPTNGQGTQQGSTVTALGVPVANGIFTTSLDFGSAQFSSGANVYLEISVRLAGGQGNYSTLAPRQQFTSAPYAIQSLNADTATTAADSDRLGGTPADQYVITEDPRLSDSRNPLAGSPSYVQNTSAVQTPANFNISGTGTANVLNATQFNIGGNRFIASPGTGNAFVGSNTGVNTTGTSNAFFGHSAGVNNSTGASNTFLGVNAGSINTVGSNNTLVGNGANVGSINLTFATALGSGAFVSTSDTVVLGRAADSVQVPGSMTVAGTSNASIFNATTQYNIAGNRMLSSGGTNNIFAGNGAGQSNSSGQANAFFGALAGTANLGGSFNSFFGYNAGAANSSGINNAFFGQGAGFKNTTASNNTFLGNGAGLNNNTGAGNTFVGSLAGQGTVGGGTNTFVGVNAGTSNVGSSNNTMFGANAGNSNLPSNGNTYLGADADGGFLVANSTAIGQKAFAGQSNSLILGGINGVNSATADTFVGIGTTTPAYRFHVLNNSDQSVLIESNSPKGAGIELKSNRAITHNWSIYTGDNQNFGYNLFFADKTTNTIVMSLRGDPTGGGVVNVDGFNANSIFMSTPPADGDAPLCFNSSILRIARCANLQTPGTGQKKEVHPFTGGMSLVDRITPVTFRWNSNGKPDVGFDAKEIEKIDPALVTYDSKGEIADVKNDRISALLVNAVKEQQIQISAQNIQIDLLKKQIEDLQKSLKEIVISNSTSNGQPSRSERGQPK